ncbi:MAG: phenylalanine--tRNA ligase subunit beta [Cardiobacteriaceae bacterium]|nr:phenylalanine--tRNA ligase subunit beta [Cardiobacteriaceae bacterium]
MRVSVSRLQKITNQSFDALELARRYTLAGLEVEEVIPAAPQFSGVVVAEVLTLEKHPDADKLRIATVNYGGAENLQIVCGAPNVAVGVKVPLATIGAVLPGEIKIKKSKLRGVESSGMLCSARELGISEDHSGLLILPADAEIGADIRAYLDLDDQIIDIDLTPNRADCFSERGLAREACVLYGTCAPDALFNADLASEKIPATSDSTVEIKNTAPAAAPIYLARVIDGVDNGKTSPIWLQEALRRFGVRAHDPLVDVTNFVMMSFGTPMHAFDAAEITGAINIRYAQEGEKITLINGSVADLNADDLLIADEEKPLAIAGVMGGIHSGCSEKTSRVVLESAWFNPDAVIGKARKFSLSSDAAQRFERGVDFQMQTAAIELATKLIVEICGGSAGKIAEFRAPEHLPQRKAIELPQEKIAKLVGREYDWKFVEEKLAALGFKQDGNKFLPPSWRFDCEIYQDLIEEIVRLGGYDNIPDALPIIEYQKDQNTAAQEGISRQRLTADKLRALGFSEAICYSFISRTEHSAFFGDAKTVNLLNPIAEDKSEMRLSLIPSLVSTVIYNRNRKQNNVKLFEIGNCFLPRGEKAVDCEQVCRVSAVISGLAAPEQWAEKSRDADFFDIKAVAETLIPNAKYQRSDAPYLHPGQSADILLDGKKVGVVGTLHPEILNKLGGKGGKIFVFEADIAAVAGLDLPEISAISKFPAVRRDIALVVDEQIAVEDLIAAIRSLQFETALLSEVFCFDVFAGKDLAAGKKSVALAIVLQNQERTLQDEEVEAVISKILEKLASEFAAVLR